MQTMWHWFSIDLSDQNVNFYWTTKNVSTELDSGQNYIINLKYNVLTTKLKTFEDVIIFTILNYCSLRFNWNVFDIEI